MSELCLGDARLRTFLQEIDSALAVECGGQSGVSMNDCLQQPAQLDAIRASAAGQAREPLR